MTEDSHYKLLKLLERNPQATQREMAGELGVSLGKINYCLKVLIDEGYVAARNFKSSGNKAAYLYLLTPQGVQAKARISAAYLQRKIGEYESLRAEIEDLQAEAGAVE